MARGEEQRLGQRAAMAPSTSSNKLASGVRRTMVLLVTIIQLLGVLDSNRSNTKSPIRSSTSMRSSPIVNYGVGHKHHQIPTFTDLDQIHLTKATAIAEALKSYIAENAIDLQQISDKEQLLKEHYQNLTIDRSHDIKFTAFDSAAVVATLSLF